MNPDVAVAFGDAVSRRRFIQGIAASAALGATGRTGLTRFFVGSVATRVVTAPCPVVTVRGR
jgi:nucleotide-binding universal stress UspA family protein